MNTLPITLDADAVDRLLPQVDVPDEMRQLFIDLGGSQAVQPPQTLTLPSDGKGDFVTYWGAMTTAQVYCDYRAESNKGI